VITVVLGLIMLFVVFHSVKRLYVLEDSDSSATVATVAGNG
jgi:hypothetical protein